MSTLSLCVTLSLSIHHKLLEVHQYYHGHIHKRVNVKNCMTSGDLCTHSSKIH